MTEEAVEPQEPVMDHVEQVEAEQEVVQEEQANEESQDANEVIENSSKKVMIPLSVAQKLREQKRELELQVQWMQQQQPAKQEPEDESRYESATREELSKSQESTIRMIEERRWIKDNPEKFERINEELPKLLKERPNLAPAINLASNRYEEADLLLNALSPKQREKLNKAPPPIKKSAPLSPNGVAKAAAINQAVDVMQMNDKEFSEWRRSQKKSR